MEQHPIPRQITTFQFKLIGFMTLNQFLYLIVFSAISYVIYKVFPIPIINILLAAIVAGVGIVFAFIPFNDRPLDLLIKNFVRHLFTPTQYLYHKESSSIYFLEDLYFQADPHRMMTHIQSAAMLSNYIKQAQSVKEPGNSTKSRQAVNKALQQSTSSLVDVTRAQPILQMPADEVVIKKEVEGGSQENIAVDNNSTDQDQAQPHQIVQIVEDPVGQPQPAISDNYDLQDSILKKPFFGGVIKSNKQVPLPNILVYMKDDQDKPLRLMKTNPHGVFATFNPLPEGEYLIEPKDPKGSFFFDTMKVNLQSDKYGSIELHSRELL